MSISRGDIYYVEKYQTYGSEQQAGRPAIIVSNNKNNDNSEAFEVVYLTTQPKNDLPTHVTIRSCAKPSTALCEQITTVYIDRLGTFVGHITEEELAMIDVALMTSLALEAPKKATAKASKTTDTEVSAMKARIEELEGHIERYEEGIRETDAIIEAAEVKLKLYEDRLFKENAKNEILKELYEQTVVQLASVKGEV